MARDRGGQTLDGDPKAATQVKQRTLTVSSHTTKGGRHVMDVHNRLEKDSPLTQRSTDDPGTDVEMDDSSAGFEGAFEASFDDTFERPVLPLVPTVEEPTEPSKTKERDKIVDAWKKHQDNYLLTLFLHEAGPEISTRCLECGQDCQALFRCLDCSACSHRCKECLVASHQFNPLHRIQEWSGSHWKFAQLFKLGLAVNLGHHGKKCPHHIPASSLIVVYHTNGAHTIRVNYCGCSTDSFTREYRYQLLQNAWFPASQADPQTVFTMDTLRLHSKLSSQGRMSGLDYYTGLELFTDSSGVQVIPNRYDEFLAVARCYGHLKMLQRSGIGHEPKGVASATEGCLAIECSMCPQPGKNMPPDFLYTPEAEAYKHGLHICHDGNFKAKGRGQRRTEDHSLLPGGTYFVNEAAYQKEIANKAHASNQRPPSNCDSKHKAFNQADTRFNKGYPVTGVVGAVCSRHGLVRANGVGDLQHGERYVNTDFVFLSTLCCTMLALIIASYDIACQWGVNFESRMALFPANLHLNLTLLALRLVIPKLHLAVHGEKCQGPFSLNFMRGVGRTDGEEVERFWSMTNPSTPSTSQMTPGHRHDSLNNLWGHMNWRKLVKAGDSLLRKIKLAIHNSALQYEEFKSLSAGFPSEVLAQWEADLVTWEADPNNVTSPFSAPVQSRNFSKCVDNLLKEEEQKTDNQREQVFGSDTLASPRSAIGFLVQGLKLEEDVVELWVHEKEDTKNEGRIAEKTLKKRKALMPRLDKWFAEQPVFMPKLPMWLAYDVASSTTITHPLASMHSKEKTDPLLLWLPSSLDSLVRSSLCSDDLVSAEIQLRIAQANDKLDNLRLWLLHQKNGFQYKHKNVSGQRPATRAFIRLATVAKKVQHAANGYRAARSALKSLDQPVDDEKHELSCFEPLLEKDVRGPLAEKEQLLTASGARARSGEGFVTHSWIWKHRLGKHHSTQQGTNIISADLRVEWFRTHARMDRWAEELVLVEEEMRRVLQYHSWKASGWREKVGKRIVDDVAMAQGLAAYAEEQAVMWEALGKKFAGLWWDVMSANKLKTEWDSCFLPARAQCVSLSSL